MSNLNPKVEVKVETTPALLLEYPCHWEYKLILKAEHDVSIPVSAVLDQRDHQLQKSQESKSGSYASYALKVLVHSDEDRKTIFHTLKSHEHIKFVL